MSKRFIMRKTSAALSCLLFLFILSAAAQSHAIEPSTATPDAPGNTAISDNNGRPKPKDTKINHDKLYILTYHNLINDENPDSMNITVQKFLKDMKWLNENGYNTILPRELCNLKASNQNLSPKTVMIVLDDGYYSNYALAFPVLKEYNIKAAVMLVTSFIRSEAPSGSPRVAPLTWDDVREMSDSGLVEFGSHTNNLHSPEYKGNYKIGAPNGVQHRKGEPRAEYRARLNADIKKSIELIKKYTGKEVDSFAYPFGEKDPWADDVLRKSGIKVTFLTGMQSDDLSRGLYDLKRFTVTEDTDLSILLSADKSAQISAPEESK